MPGFLQFIADHLEQLGFGAYWAVSIMVFLESILVIGHFIPGGIFLAFFGFLCYAQVFDFPQMLLAVFFGHFLGEIANYYLGRIKGRALFREDSRYLKPRYLQAAERRFAQGGVRILVLSQFIGVFRSVISVTAGIVHYPLLKFLFVMFFSAFAWALVHLGIGFLLGASWHQAAHYIEGFSLVILVVLPTIFFSGWIIRRLGQHAGDFGRWIERISRKIHSSQRYQQLAGKHPKVFRFAEARLSLSADWGFRATIGLFASFVLTISYVNILFDVCTTDNWRNFDFSVVNLLAQLRKQTADSIFLFISHLGSGPVLAALVVLSAAVCLRRRQFKSLFVLLLSPLLALMFAWVFHVFYIRVRPSAFTGIDGKLLFNFPVGHMCVTVASFAAAYHWLWNHPGRMKLRMFLAFALLVICIMIGFSRLYLGVHFPSEVVAGFFIGFGCVIFSATVAQNLSRVTDARVRADLPALVILSLCVLVAVFYFGRTKRRPPADGYVLSQPSIETTQTLLARLPRETHGLSGELLVPTDVIIIGEIAPVVARLRALGWGTIRPSDFFSTEISAPVFPVFVNSAPPFTALERRIADHRLIFRAWKTKFKTPEQHPVFIASVVAEQRVTKAFGISAYHIQPDLDIVLNQLAADLQGLHVTTVSFRRRGLYQWKYPFFTHGGALLVAPI